MSEAASTCNQAETCSTLRCVVRRKSGPTSCSGFSGIKKVDQTTKHAKSATGIAVRIEEIYQAHSRQVLATLIRLLGDFEQAEEALQEAFALALKQWPEEGMPGNPVAWLVSAGRFKSIDQIRRAQTARRYAPMLVEDEAVDDPAQIGR